MNKKSLIQLNEIMKYSNDINDLDSELSNINNLKNF